MAVEDLMTKLAGYHARRTAERAERVEATLAAMTPREQRLVREAAVMGYVRGQIAGRCGEDRPPSDTAVLTEVIACCREMPDLYPIIASLTEVQEA